MINTLLGTKKGMTSSYDARGRRVGATVVELGPNFIIQVKTMDGKDKYNALQIGFSQKKSVKKPQQGLFKKLGVPENLRWLREVRVKSEEEQSQVEMDDMKPGQEIKVGDVDRKSTRLNSSHSAKSRMPSSA